MDLLLDQGVAIEETAFSIEDFLAAEQAKELVRFSTAGSVDDGKSTLIGRLLYDSQNVYEDHVRAVTKAATANVAAAIDFAQLTDGLRAEREQGITIDVAYRYFSTTHRKFIIADTPGHEQYTRNMATGASTADVAIILVDARKGILTQSRRHAYIASLLGTRHIVAAVNKMDLMEYSSEVFRSLAHDLEQLAHKLGISNLVSIPVSALLGDNVVDRGLNMPWYDGPTLLEYLETVAVGHDAAGAPFRLPIQRVIRPDQDYRGFAGQIASGSVWPGDRVIALPSGRTSRVKSITTFDGDLARAMAPMSVAVTLEDELDISRGEMLAAAHEPPVVAANFVASLVWMDAQPLDLGRSYLLKHTSQTVKARVKTVRHRVNMQTLDHEPAATLELNSIGLVEVETTRPLFLDTYASQRLTGSFILIDAVSNATVAAGMVREVVSGEQEASTVAAVAVRDPELLRLLENALREVGTEVVRTRTTNQGLIQRLLQIGVVVLIEAHGLEDFPGEVTFALPGGTGDSLAFEPVAGLPEEPAAAVMAILRAFNRGGPMSLVALETQIDAARSLVNEQIAAARKEDICVTSSFQAEDMVVVHLVRESIGNVPVIFLDTGYHFAETYAYRDRLAKEWDLNLVNVLPPLTVAEQESQFGILNQSAPDRCCGLRKVGPLFASLEPYRLWFTGLRREQAKTRANLQAVDAFTLPTGKQLLKVSPLAEWSTRDVWQYAERHAIPLLPLYDKGYTSIGCEPCTSLPFDPGDPRSGRWGGRKQECGIHVQPQ